jgi:hypothetical protein
MLGDLAFEEAFADGAAMDPAGAVQYARRELGRALGEHEGTSDGTLSRSRDRS